MNTSNIIITGVVSGVLAAAIIHILISFFKAVVLIWYRRLIYRGIDVSGKWIQDTTLPTGTQESSVMHITQVVDKVEATLSITQRKKDDTTSTIKTYKLVGELRERFLMMTGSNMDPQSIGVCSLLLQIVGAGDEMEGIDSFYNVTSKNIMGNPVTWRRSKSMDSLDRNNPESVER